MSSKYILALDYQGATLDLVGGKGISLMRMVNAGLPVPAGFLVTTDAYWHFVAENNLQAGIQDTLKSVDSTDPAALELASRSIMKLFVEGTIPVKVAEAIFQTYTELPGETPAVAVRSSATAEDLPEASFAGQQDTYLNFHLPIY